MSLPLNELGYDPEYALVGALIVHSDHVPIPRDVTPAWFANPVARTVFTATAAVAALGIMPSALAVKQKLTDMGQYERIGGDAFFIEIMQATYSKSQIPQLIEVLRPLHIRRQVREIADWLGKVSSRDDLTVAEIASRLIEGANEAMGALQAPVRSIGDIDHDGDDTGVTTGYSALDGLMTTGGYPAGQMSVISAYHKGGKTTFMLSSALLQLAAGKRVLWATFADLNEKQLKRRMLRNLCGWSKRPDRLDLAADYDEQLGWLNRAPMDVYDATKLTSGFDVDTFAMWLQAHAGTAGYDCVFVDYAQKLRAAKASANRFAEGDYCSEVIARLAAQVGLPIVIGSQITPGGKDGETKTKNSRAWEEDAGLVVRLKREGSVVDCEVPFSRFGPSGEFTLRWDQERLRMVAA